MHPSHLFLDILDSVILESHDNKESFSDEGISLELIRPSDPYLKKG